MAATLESSMKEALHARLRFYRDLGMTELYRRPVDPELLAQFAQVSEARPSSSASGQAFEELRAVDRAPAPDPTLLGGPGLDSETWDASPAEPKSPEYEPIPLRKPISPPPAVLTEIKPADKAAALRLIQEDIGDCTRCGLHKGRNKLVFADGSPNARLMFVGEGPGADEDAQGLPFVGRAGQLLNNMITAMGLKREEVYIANVVKCRPPGNRTPEPEEANTCSPFLFRQIDVVRPDVIVALGATAATYLLGQRQPLAGLRGRVHSFRGTRLIVTYHPAFLLRDPRQKKEAWADLQIAMSELGLKLPGRG